MQLAMYGSGEPYMPAAHIFDFEPNFYNNKKPSRLVELISGRPLGKVGRGF